MTLALLAAGAALAPSALRAAEGDPVWYGSQTLAEDGAAAALTSVAMVRLLTDDNYVTRHFEGPSVTGLWIGTAVFALGTPIVHAAHGHVGRAFGSLGLRIGLPLVFAILFGHSGCGDTDVPCLASGKGAVAGALVGAIGASAIDAFWAEDEPAEDARVALVPGGVRIRF